MKPLFTFLLFTLSVFTLSAQNWLWAKEGEGNAEGLAVAADRFGNSFLTGTFTRTVNFGKYSVSTSITDSDYPGEVFLVKYDSSGSPLWAKQGVNNTINSRARGNDVATDFAGNSYLTGYFYDTILFGNDTLKSINPNAFLVKYDPSGNIIWARQSVTPGTVASAIAYSTTVDASGNVYITGQFTDTVSFGANILKVKEYGQVESFIVKYNNSGSVVFARQSSSNNIYCIARGYAVTTDVNKNIYISGELNDTITFGSITLRCSNGNAFIIKYDSNGNTLWGQISNANSLAKSYSVITDNVGNVYITGYFSGKSVIFSKDTLKMEDTAEAEMFLTKYNQNGNELWTKQLHFLNSNGFIGYAASIDNSGRIYVSAGEYLNTSTQYKFLFSGDTITGTNDGPDVASALLEYDTAGKELCASALPAAGDDQITVATDPTGKYIYMGGDVNANNVVIANDTLVIPNSFIESPIVLRWQHCTSPEAINELHSDSMRVRVYPNPSNGAFKLEFSHPVPIAIGMNNAVEVYNVLGEKIYSGSFNIYPDSYRDSEFKINLSDKPSGIYLYRIISEKGELIGSGKLIKE